MLTEEEKGFKVFAVSLIKSDLPDLTTIRCQVLFFPKISTLFSIPFIIFFLLHCFFAVKNLLARK